MHKAGSCVKRIIKFPLGLYSTHTLVLIALKLTHFTLLLPKFCSLHFDFLSFFDGTYLQHTTTCIVPDICHSFPPGIFFYVDGPKEIWRSKVHKTKSQNPARSDEIALHPSWEASKRKKLLKSVTFQGQRTVFTNSDDESIT